MSGISKDLPFKEYWWAVVKITEGEEEQWEVCDILPRFARALGTHSTQDLKRREDSRFKIQIYILYHIETLRHIVINSIVR